MDSLIPYYSFLIHLPNSETSTAQETNGLLCYMYKLIFGFHYNSESYSLSIQHRYPCTRQRHCGLCQLVTPQTHSQHLYASTINPYHSDSISTEKLKECREMSPQALKASFFLEKITYHVGIYPKFS